MKISFKRLIPSFFLLAILLVSLKKYTEWDLSKKPSTGYVEKTEFTVSNKKNTENSTITIPPVDGGTINQNISVSIEKNDTNMVTSSSFDTEENTEPSAEDVIASHNDRWQDVMFDYASMDDTYYDMTYPLAKIIYAEGGGQNDTCQQYIGYVVINRIESKYYPNTLKRVFFSGGYAPESQEKYRDGNCSDRAIENAKIVVNNYYNDTMPVSPALVYQSKFSQGVNQFKIDGEEFGYDERILNDLEQQ